jgi:hypothetical protein
LSAANCGPFSCARIFFSLADEGHAPKALQKHTKRGIPLLALCVSMPGGLASLISSVVAPTTVYLVLVSVAGCHRGRRDVHHGGTLLPSPELPALGRRHRNTPLQRPAVTNSRVCAVRHFPDRHWLRPRPGNSPVLRSSLRGRRLRRPQAPGWSGCPTWPSAWCSSSKWSGHRG